MQKMSTNVRHTSEGRNITCMFSVPVCRPFSFSEGNLFQTHNLKEQVLMLEPTGDFQLHWDAAHWTSKTFSDFSLVTFNYVFFTTKLAQKPIKNRQLTPFLFFRFFWCVMFDFMNASENRVAWRPVTMLHWLLFYIFYFSLSNSTHTNLERCLSAARTEKDGIRGCHVQVLHKLPTGATSRCSIALKKGRISNVCRFQQLSNSINILSSDCSVYSDVFCLFCPTKLN